VHFRAVSHDRQSFLLAVHSGRSCLHTASPSGGFCFLATLHITSSASHKHYPQLIPSTLNTQHTSITTKTPPHLQLLTTHTQATVSSTIANSLPSQPNKAYISPASHHTHSSYYPQHHTHTASKPSSNNGIPAEDLHHHLFHRLRYSHRRPRAHRSVALPHVRC
jgi:hypothetical protein